MSSSSRLRALRLYLALAVVPVALAFLVMGNRLALLLGAMWFVLVMTAGLAATSSRPQVTSTWHERGRLHG
ncbi:MAG TPA: hypothetical protein VM433_06135 [Mycobacteriales bacterium]|nr:hypothetical protein [Mycobacteriales bacterium]